VVGTEYQLVAEAVPQLIWVTDGSGAVEYVNQKYADYTGYRREELYGQTEWRKALHPDDVARCLRDWRSATVRGSAFETEYRLLRAADSTWRWHLTRALPVKDERGGIVKWFGTCTDIEEQKRAQEILRLSEERILQESRRKDELLAMLGHELRNPLAPVLNAVQLLRARGGHAHEVEIIERQTLQMARLVDDLLDVSRINTGRVQLRKEPHVLARSIERAVEATMPLIEERKHQLVVDVDERLAVDADPVRLAQVLTNLLNNAAKYMERGGTIAVRAIRDRDQVVVSVTDRGVGIPADELPHVFDLFVQGQRSLDRAQGGLGIGLTLVRTLVEMHGGTITARSDGPGCGSEFVVRLPAHDLPLHHKIAEPVEPPAATGARILVVDDNADIVDVLTSYLTWKGYEVHAAHDGASALETAQRIIPAVVLLDIGLPGMNGYEVARRLRADTRLASARLIALTGYGQDRDRERAIAAGFHHHLTKPVDLEKLLALIASCRGSAPSRAEPSRYGQQPSAG